MRNFYLFIFFIFFSVPLFAEIVPGNIASEVGRNFYMERINHSGSFTKSQIQITDTFKYESDGLLLYYVFNISTGGFVIVSATDNSYPVLGYSFEGAFKQGKEADNYAAWMNSYSKQLKKLITDKTPPTSQILEDWSKLKDPDYLSKNKKDIKGMNPLLTSKWGQGVFYNDMCPLATNGPGGHCVAGCVGVAMAQTLYYYKYPFKGYGTVACSSVNETYIPVNLDNSIYGWLDMADSVSSQNSSVAELVYDCGASVETQYAGNGSGASFSSCVNALKNNFRYINNIENIQRKNYSDSAWENIIIQNLDKKMPVMYDGKDSSSGAGHAFVCDGYQDSDFFHFNWGWNGSFNGYYYLQKLNPGGNYDFILLQSAIINIFPDTINYSYPSYCSGLTVFTKEAMTFDDGSGLKHDYKDNSNCEWLITSNENVKMKLDFVSFNTEPGFDKLYVYDGNSSDAPLLGCFSGNTLPPAITATTNKMFLRFITNDSIHAAGWVAKYSSIYPDYNCKDTTFYLYDTKASFDDGSGKYYYFNNIDYKWIIQLPSIYNITLTIDSMDVEKDKDFIYIYDMHYTPPVLLKTLTGKGNNISYKFYTNNIKLVFKTDYQNNAAGWKAHYTSDFILRQNSEQYNFVCFPDPTDGELNIYFEILQQTNATLEIVETTGLPVYYEEMKKYSGIYNKTFNVSFFKKGTYIIKLITDREVVIKKFEKL